MVIPYPERISVQYTILFAGVLMLVQLAEGTSPIFALMMFCSNILWVLSFNLLGGLYRISGMFVFGQGVFGITTPLIIKAGLRQAADTLLIEPQRFATVVFVGELSVLFASFLVVKIRPRKAIFHGNDDKFRISEMAVGATALMVINGFLISAFRATAASQGSWVTMLSQLSSMMGQFALALNVCSAIESSNGRRTYNFLTLLVGGWITYVGFVHASKTAVLQPLAVYIVCCAACKVRFSRLQYVAMIGVVAFVAMFVYPLLQSYHSTDEANRGLTIPELVDKFANSRQILETQKVNKAMDFEMESANGEHGDYFGKDVGFFTRYSNVIALDASLIATVKDGDYMGYDGAVQGLINWIPHVLYPNKPSFFSSQSYMHRIPGSNPEDTTTGVSFGAFATSFAMGGWVGLIFLVIVVQGGFMLTMDVVCPSVKNTSWMVCMLALMLPVGAECNIDALISITWFYSIEIAFTVVMARYGVRAFSSVFGGSQRAAKLEEFRAAQQTELLLRNSAR
jgi:hypothetical protein